MCKSLRFKVAHNVNIIDIGEQLDGLKEEDTPYANWLGVFLTQPVGVTEIWSAYISILFSMIYVRLFKDVHNIPGSCGNIYDLSPCKWGR